MIKTLLKLVVLAALLLAGYLYLVPGAKLSDLTKHLPLPPRTDPATGLPLVDCPTCQATGSTKCAAPKCVDGKVECNGPCLRLTKGRWFKDPKLGKGPDIRWQEFRNKDGKYYWTEQHVGEVVENIDGKHVITGICKVCEGTTRMPCKVCQGLGQVTCRTCQGRKEIPDPGKSSAQKPAPSASTASVRPSETIRLRNGQTVTGTVVIRDERLILVRTADGKTTQIDPKDVAP